jgi:phage-related protein
MSKAGIEIPSEFTFKGVFGLILQIIGITKDWIRSRVVKLIGAKNVERIEKAWSIVSTLISGGIGGLWEKAKKYLSDLKDKLFDTIQNWLITEIVKQAIIWVISLFNPVAALLKIIKMIYDVVMFFIENIDRILKLVEAVIQSAAQIVAGNIGAAANWIEQAMARTLPIIISFLARILGISGIANKIKGFIKKIQKKVRGVVDKILKKIVKGIKKIIGKGKAFGKTAVRKGKAAAKKVKELIFPKRTYKIGKETHTIEEKKTR